MIPDEPVRGHTPPRWIGALSGIERCRAYSRGQLPATPMARLLGFRTTHVAAGTVTVAMPASDASIAGNGQLEICPAMIGALEGASHTALPAGFDIHPLRLTFDPFRPAWPGRGNVLARARVVNSSQLFVFASVQVEDSDGRHIGQGSLHSAVLKIDPPPPAPPESMAQIKEPVYDSADPYLRSFPISPIAEIMERDSGLSMLRQFRDGQLLMPAASLYGLVLEVCDEGRVVLSMPASEWFCAFDQQVSPQAIGAFTDMAVSCGLFALHEPGTTHALIGCDTRFLRRAAADGRRLTAEVIVTATSRHLHTLAVTVRDADGGLVAEATGFTGRFDDSRRQRRRRTESRRVLATLLFIDIVDSTGHASRLGDAGWRALLERHRLKVRREISRFSGTEVDTAGDGFFVRFDSPAYAVDAARAVRAANATLGLEIRAGIHTGECETAGSRLTGLAVHVAARVMAEAAPGEILVTSTVRELTGGSGIRYTELGQKPLKGVPEPWRLFRVED